MTDLVNIGAFSNDGTGDPARVAFAKINAFAAGVLNGTTGIPPSYLVAALPVTAIVGQFAIVTNALNPVYLQPVAGVGLVTCLVMWNGSAWVCT